MCTWPAASRSLKTGPESILHQNRRQKKRCSFGVRTVELERSKSGYGFTISGQYPCILSCIVSQSPAERVGLRPGDYLIAVNNKNVSKSLHDDVVRLIGNSTGVLKLQIADNYYTDSSGDEQITIVRPKLKYPNRTKHALSQIRAEKVVEDLQAGLLFKSERSAKQHDYKNITDAQLLMHQTLNANKINEKENCYIEDEVNSLMYASLHQVQPKCEDDAFYRAVVGYLGTIEMPKDLQIPRLQAIRNCIRRLRVEKKVHILVLLSVYHEKVTLINLRGTKVAEYPSEKITYSGIYANDKKFFGLVTSNEKRTRSSCHVFIVESKMKLHSIHLQGARTFNMKCNLNSGCEFPETAEPILCAISSLYRNRANGGSFGLIDVTLTNRSNTSSNSSNSDSGIGFRDDFHHQKDSVFVVHDNSHAKRTSGVQSPATVSLNQGENRLTVRAMPNPIGLLNGSSGRNSCNFERNSFHKYAPNKKEKGKSNLRPSLIRPMIAMTPKRMSPNLAENKLSPKVYGVKYPNQLTGRDIMAGTAAAVDNCYDLSCKMEMDDCKLKDGSQEVNPSEGRYETSESDAEEDYSQVDNKWIRISSPPTCKQVQLHSTEADGISNCEDLVNGKSSSNMMGLGVNNAKSLATQGSRVANWALSFDRLLEDPAGVHTFAVFLKREFSFENIRFWVACERYKVFAVTEELMRIKAREIFQRHLCIGASEPVNVDSQAQQIAEENLDNPDTEIFIPAQKQIYNLMKFDCYLRFLKSSIYKDTLVKEISDETLLQTGDDDLDPSLPYTDNNIPIKGQKDRIMFEEHRRKSLLSWNRAKKTENGDPRKSTRKKRKDKKDDAMSETHGSRSSLANGDLATIQRYTSSRESLNGIESYFSEDGCTLCRVLLPDESTAVVQTKCGESVLSILRNLTRRRNLDYTAVDVFLADSNKTIGSYEDSRILCNLEIRIEERTLFRLTLPNKKTLVLKNDCNQIIRDALRAVLNRCGFKMESVVVTTCNNQEIDMNLPAKSFDKQGLVVDFKEKQLEWGSNAAIRRKADDVDPTLRLFDDILNEKVQPQWDEYGVWDVEKINDNKNSLERMSAGILGVVRRNSLHFERDIKKFKNKNRASIHESLNHRIVQQPVTEKPPIHKGYKKEKENEDLYQVWERAQRSRLDDQRGTEINFDMPDFLKPQPKKPPLENRSSEPSIRTKYYNDPNNQVVIDDFSGNSVIPTVDQAEDFFSAKSADSIYFTSKDEQPYFSTKKLSLTSKPSMQFPATKVSMAKPERTLSFPDPNMQNLPPDNKDDSLTPSKISPPSNINDTSLHVEEANFTPPPRLQLPTPPNTPPPLPPKPKYYPPRPSFGVKKVANTAQDPNKKRTSKETNNEHKLRSRRAMYIERDLGDKFSISFV